MNIIDKGILPYLTSYEQMTHFTQNRTAETEDETWILEHPAVFTLGRHADPAHLLNANNIETVNTDRGGQITYHGPGQLVSYFLCDLKRQQSGPRAFVCALEQMIIDCLAEFDIQGERIDGKPGIYVNGSKIASIGLRVKQGRTYHGISLNVDMDLKPFTYINPCGYKDLTVTQMKNLNPSVTMADVKKSWEKQLHDD